jgi:hypothetical protein
MEPDVVLFAQGIRSESRSAGITNIFLALVDLIDIGRQRRRGVAIFYEDVVHYVEHAYAQFPRYRRKPRLGMQGTEGVGKPLLPSRFPG